MIPRNNLVRLARHWLEAFIDPYRALGIFHLPRYFLDCWYFKRLAKTEPVLWQNSFPCLSDWISNTPFDPHYFYQACWASRKLNSIKTALHVDVGSSVNYVGVISAQVPTIFIEIRPLKATVSGLIPLGGNLLALPFADGKISSLSCLHVIEHIGLGRYGDTLDPQGSLKAARELVRVLVQGGKLLLSTPVGRESVEFNAHRIFSPEKVLNMFSDLVLADFALVDDKGIFSPHADPAQALNCEYGCGMFEFIKP